MFRRRPKARWLIDPLRVAFGSVIGADRRSLSRSHVRVKYHHESETHFVPLATFIRRCREEIRTGRPLAIEHLLVAPVVKRRHATFFDHLTDWGPAKRRAYRSPFGGQPPESRDR